MLTTLLFIAIIISCKTFTKGFAKLPRFSMKINPRRIPSSKTKLNVRLTSSYFYDDDDYEDEKDNLKKKYNYNYEYDSDFSNIRQEDNETLYTLIWFDCEDCKQLLKDVKNDHKQIFYINGGYYFFDEKDETSSPLFYKNDILIAEDIFSIYEELFFNKINEELSFNKINEE